MHDRFYTREATSATVNFLCIKPLYFSVHQPLYKRGLPEHKPFTWQVKHLRQLPLPLAVPFSLINYIHFTCHEKPYITLKKYLYNITMLYWRRYVEQWQSIQSLDGALRTDALATTYWRLLSMTRLKSCYWKRIFYSKLEFLNIYTYKSC